MKKNILILVLIIGLTLGWASVSLGGNVPNVLFRDVRASGMGGAGIATMDGFNALMYNPAMLGYADFGVEIVNIQANIGKDVIDLIKFVDDNQDALDNFSSLTLTEQEQLLSDMDKFDYNKTGAGFSPKLGVVIKNYAAGIYATSEAQFRLDKGIYDPKIFVSGQYDLVFTAGYGNKLPDGMVAFLPHNLYYGVDLKIINRSSTSFQSSASDMGFDNVLDTLKENKTNGFGVDLGLLYELKPGNIKIGMKIVDVLSKMGDDKMPMVVNVGASWQIKEQLLLAMDYNDLFMHESNNFFNRLYFGAELNIANNLLGRAGFAQGYPTIGMGVNLGVFAMDGAIYAVEESKSPGGDGEYNYALRLRIGL